MQKTFMVADASGAKVIESEQLATFAGYVQNEQFRFVVVRVPGSNVISLTHRASGKRVAEVPFISVQAALGDYEVAGKDALNKLIERAGAARVRSVLAAAE